MQRIHRNLRVFLILAITLALSCGSALAGWNITDLGAVLTSTGSNVTSAWASSINNSGDVVGKALFSGNTYTHAALWRNGVAYDLGTLHDSSEAHYITDSGLIVGEAYADPHANNMYRQAVTFSVGSSPVNIHSSMAYGANNSVATAAGNGYILGQAYNDDVSTSHAVLWSNNGTTAVDMNPTGYTSTASALKSINSSSQMVGYSVPIDIGYSRPTIWNPNSDGTYDLSKATYLDISQNPKYSGLNWRGISGYANDINNSGQIPVWFTNGIGGIWQNGTFTEIENHFGFSGLDLAAINDSGIAVGRVYGNTNGEVSRAVMYANGNLVDLGALLAETGWYLTEAIDINDNGQILTKASKTGFVNGSESDTFFLTLTPTMTPTPIPAALPLFGSGLALLGLCRRKLFRA